MGCCLSTRPEASARPPVEEETVKEVLLETPISLPKVAITNETETEKLSPENQELKKAAAAASFEPRVEEIKNASPEKPSKQVPGMSSFIESLSNATEKNEGEDGSEVTQRLPSARKRDRHQQVVRKKAPPPRVTPRSPEKKAVATRTIEAAKEDNGKERDIGEEARNGWKGADPRNVSENGGGKDVYGRIAEEDLEHETLENPVVSFECFIFL